MTGELVLPNTAGQDEWLAARRLGIGASEIAAVAGLSRRRGPWDVWSSKVDGTEFESTDEMRWGQWIEGRIIDWWARKTDRTIGNGGLWRHPVHRWLLATPDAVVLDHTTADKYGPAAGVPVVTAVVDAKNAGWHGGGDWDEDGAPLEYIAQVTQQMLAVGVNDAYLVAAIGGKPPTERHFALDDDLAAELIKRGEQFWKLVETRTPPPLDGSKSATRWLANRYPDADPDYFADLTPAEVGELAELVAVDERIAALTTVRDELANGIKERLGTASVGTYEGRDMVTWKSVERKGYTVKATTFRKFTIPAKVRKDLSGGND